MIDRERRWHPTSLPTRIEGVTVTRLLAAALPVIFAAALLAACVPGSGSDGAAGAIGGEAAPAPTAHLPEAEGPVIATGLVLQKDGEPPVLCLGIIAMSYPPQCSGPEIIGWNWETAPLSESSGGVRWGDYAIAGKWDGRVFTITEPPLPLSDYTPPSAAPDPRRDPAMPGPATGSELAELQRELTLEQSELGILLAVPENGYLWVTVIYDDGTIQRKLDEAYGEGRIIVVSALQNA